jgi:hypothetical protein
MKSGQTLSVPAEVLQRTGGQPVSSIVYDEATIAERVQELGLAVTRDLPEGELLVLGLLKGSFIFLSDLVRQIRRPLQVDFLVASSYGKGKVSSGDVKLLYDPETRLEGKHILLVEDIIDSGNTRGGCSPSWRPGIHGRSRSAPCSTRGSWWTRRRQSGISASRRRRPSWWATASIMRKTSGISLSSRI